MIKIMIVDDEPIVRQGIKTSIDWDSYGVKLIGEAINGRDALEKIPHFQPDILITDIRMPVMDGLELAEVVRKKLPDTKIIILSGYDDFEYAKKSIRLNVVEYLLKPVGAEELIAVILALKDKIINERQKKRELQNTKMLIEENIGLIRTKFIQGLLKNKYREESFIYKRAENLNLKLCGPEFQIILVDIDDFFLLSEDMSPAQREAFTHSVLETTADAINIYIDCILCPSENDYLIGVLNLLNNGNLRLTTICKEVQKSIKEQLKLSVTISIGKAYSNIFSLSKSYNQALLALRKKVHYGKDSIIYYNELDEDEKNTPLLFPTEKEKELLNELRFLNIMKIKELIEQLFAGFAEEMVDYSCIKNTTLRLILMALGILAEMGINVEEELPNKLAPYNEIEKYETVEDIKLWLEKTLEHFIKIINNNKSKKYRDIINKAFRYIKDNYNKEISLEDIANVVFVTPPYFSKVFKEETGENFTSWLNKYRIEQAINLLKNDSSIKCYEVSSQVGYNDYKYFSSIFKKTTGLTFSEYREKEMKR